MSSSAVMAAGTLVSRLLGMVRVVVLAWAIGAAFSANAFTTANTLPNQLFLLIGGGVLNAVLVPQIVGAMKRPDGGRDYVDRLLTLSLGLLAVATVVVTAGRAAVPVVLRSATGTASSSRVAAAFAFWCMPQVFFYGLYTMLGQVLNARGSFGPYMWAPVVNNVVAIAGHARVRRAVRRRRRIRAGWWTPGAIAVLAGTTTLGVVAQALVLVPVLRRLRVPLAPAHAASAGSGCARRGQVAGWTVRGARRRPARAGSPLPGREPGRGRRRGRDRPLRLRHRVPAVHAAALARHRLGRDGGVHADVRGRRRRAACDDVRGDVSIALRTTGVATVLATVGVRRPRVTT